MQVRSLSLHKMQVRSLCLHSMQVTMFKSMQVRSLCLHSMQVRQVTVLTQYAGHYDHTVCKSGHYAYTVCKSGHYAFIVCKSGHYVHHLKKQKHLFWIQYKISRFHHTPHPTPSLNLSFFSSDLTNHRSSSRKDSSFSNATSLFFFPLPWFYSRSTYNRLFDYNTYML